MGALENTRRFVSMSGFHQYSSDFISLHSLGDLKYKPFGVTPEPEVRTKLLNGQSVVFGYLDEVR